VASSAVNVPNPVSAPTAVQLAQIADNVANVLQTGTQKGSYEDVYKAIQDLALAVRCCAQALLAIDNTTASSVGTVTTRGQQALGAAAVIPTALSAPSI
jgi:hypothetical protein